MLEDQRYDLSLLRDSLRETAEQAERLERALTKIGLLLPPLADKPRAGERNAKRAPRS
jgi:hypothetical protein